MALDLDVDALLGALGKPRLTIGGEVHVGRYPSFTEYFEILQAWNVTDWQNADSVKATIKCLCERLGFPPEPIYDLPESMIMEVMHHFLVTSGGRDGGMDALLTSNGPSAPSESSPAPSP